MAAGSHPTGELSRLTAVFNFLQFITQLEQINSRWRTLGRVIWELNRFATSPAYSCLDDRLTEVSTLPSGTMAPVLTRLNQYLDDKPGEVT